MDTDRSAFEWISIAHAEIFCDAPPEEVQPVGLYGVTVGGAEMLGRAGLDDLALQSFLAPDVISAPPQARIEALVRFKLFRHHYHFLEAYAVNILDRCGSIVVRGAIAIAVALSSKDDWRAYLPPPAPDTLRDEVYCANYIQCLLSSGRLVESERETHDILRKALGADLSPLIAAELAAAYGRHGMWEESVRFAQFVGSADAVSAYDIICLAEADYFAMEYDRVLTATQSVLSVIETPTLRRRAKALAVLAELKRSGISGAARNELNNLFLEDPEDFSIYDALVNLIPGDRRVRRNALIRSSLASFRRSRRWSAALRP